MEPNTQQNTNKRVIWNEHDFPAPEKPSIGIEFFNVNSGEKRIADTEALITAFYNSSNLHVNAMVGQDLGWRLAASTVKRMRDLREDETTMQRIVTRFRLTEESDVTDPHLLTYMFHEDLKRAAKAEEVQQSQYQRQYEDELRALDEEILSDTPAPEELAKVTKKVVQPKLSAAQRKSAQKQLADQKRREANLEAGRDINDGIELSEAEKAALGEADKEVAKSDKNDDNETQS
jgi:hypothetical protein